MEQLFDTLKLGSKVETREDKFSPWLIAEVVSIDGDDIVFHNDDVGEIHTDRDEVNDDTFFRSVR